MPSSLGSSYLLPRSSSSKELSLQKRTSTSSTTPLLFVLLPLVKERAETGDFMLSGVGTMVFLPFTVWLLGKNYGQVRNWKFSNMIIRISNIIFGNIFSPARNRQIREREKIKTKIPGLATRGRNLPLLNSLHGNSTISILVVIKCQCFCRCTIF